MSEHYHAERCTADDCNLPVIHPSQPVLREALERAIETHYQSEADHPFHSCAEQIVAALAHPTSSPEPLTGVDMGRDTPGDEGKDRTQWKDRTTGVSRPSTTTTPSRASTAGRPSQEQTATTEPSPTKPSPLGSIASGADGSATSPSSTVEGGEAAQPLAALDPVSGYSEPPASPATGEGLDVERLDYLEGIVAKLRRDDRPGYWCGNDRLDPIPDEDGAL